MGQGMALVRYETKEEAIKAQKSLNTCLFGNTTIVAEFINDLEFQQQMADHSNTNSSNMTYTQQYLSDMNRSGVPPRGGGMGGDGYNRGATSSSSYQSSMSGFQSPMWSGSNSHASGGMWPSEDNSGLLNVNMLGSESM